MSVFSVVEELLKTEAFWKRTDIEKGLSAENDRRAKKIDINTFVKTLPLDGTDWILNVLLLKNKDNEEFKKCLTLNKKELINGILDSADRSYVMSIKTIIWNKEYYKDRDLFSKEELAKILLKAPEFNQIDGFIEEIKSDFNALKVLFSEIPKSEYNHWKMAKTKPDNNIQALIEANIENLVDLKKTNEAEFKKILDNIINADPIYGKGLGAYLDHKAGNFNSLSTYMIAHSDNATYKKLVKKDEALVMEIVTIAKKNPTVASNLLNHFAREGAEHEILSAKQIVEILAAQPSLKVFQFKGLINRGIDLKKIAEDYDALEVIVKSPALVEKIGAKKLAEIMIEKHLNKGLNNHSIDELENLAKNNPKLEKELERRAPEVALPSAVPASSSPAKEQQQDTVAADQKKNTPSNVKYSP